MNPQDSWLLVACALCGETFDTVRYGHLESAVPCECTTRRAAPPEPTTVADVIRSADKELAARRAANGSLP